MFIATVKAEIVAVNKPGGRTTSTGQVKNETIGNQFPDRAAAEKACEEHFSVLRSKLQEQVPDNPLIGQAKLEWSGNSGSPDMPLGIRGLSNPPPLVYEVSYTVYDNPVR